MTYAGSLPHTKEQRKTHHLRRITVIVETDQDHPTDPVDFPEKISVFGEERVPYPDRDEYKVTSTGLVGFRFQKCLGGAYRRLVGPQVEQNYLQCDYSP